MDDRRNTYPSGVLISNVAYESQLRHVARPEKDRQSATRVRLEDWQALALQDPLVEYASYVAPDAEHEAVAMAYAEYIDMVVREEAKNHVYLYAHTDVAEDVLLFVDDCNGLNTDMTEQL